MLKCDASIVLPKVDEKNIFLAVKFVFLHTASSNRCQSKDLKERSLKIGRNLSFEVRKWGFSPLEILATSLFQIISIPILHHLKAQFLLISNM